jgi:hypothetical protein
MHQLQRAVDAFQIATAAQWRRQIQWLSLGLSVIVAPMILGVNPATAEHFALLLAGIVLSAGLAPVARDVVGAIQALRR